MPSHWVRWPLIVVTTFKSCPQVGKFGGNLLHWEVDPEALQSIDIDLYSEIKHSLSINWLLGSIVPILTPILFAIHHQSCIWTIDNLIFGISTINQIVIIIIITIKVVELFKLLKSSIVVFIIFLGFSPDSVVLEVKDAIFILFFSYFPDKSVQIKAFVQILHKLAKIFR